MVQCLSEREVIRDASRSRKLEVETDRTVKT